MQTEQIKLLMGCLLHDIGKVLYRVGESGTHSSSGYDFLLNEIKIEDQEILDCIRFHHAADIKKANLEKNALAYICYFADNIAAAIDRREGKNTGDGFDRSVPLASVFNLLNGNDKKGHYARRVLDPKAPINYPTTADIKMDDSFYESVQRNITENLKGLAFSEEYLVSLLEVLEANLSYVPFSTSKREQTDISLYDHMKITAAIGACLQLYLQENDRHDYHKETIKSDLLYKEEAFLLYSMDVSGIQKFIYTIASKDALRMLRARSFYLDFILEHCIDELLKELTLTRANLIYSGGGHAYILIPNTETAENVVQAFEKDLNKWLRDQYGTSLYVAGGYAACSANSLQNKPAGSYSEIFKAISRKIADKKAHRYDPDEIRILNRRKTEGMRECRVCRQVKKLDENDMCPTCSALKKISGDVLYTDYFAVTTEHEEGALELPGNKYLVPCSETRLRRLMESDSYVRSYSKNIPCKGKHISTKLWIGSYTTGSTFEQFAKDAEGIKRIGILRADVDNLGNAFVNGFIRPNGNEKYVTLSRTAALSRQLSLFFKCYINQICEEIENRSLYEKKDKVFGRNVTIVYSGGDDVFLVGSWNDVIMTFIDLRNAFDRFTEGALTLSGGVGIYPAKFPINVMAQQTASLEDKAKQMDGKNAVTIFETDQCFSWQDMTEKVLDEKLAMLKGFFAGQSERGKAFLYHLLDLLRDDSAAINKARYAYLLARLEPDQSSSPEEKEHYRKFAGKMYEWRNDPKSRRELLTAIYLYVYMTRNGEDEE